MRLFNIIDTSFTRFDNTVQTYLQKTMSALGIPYTNNNIFGVIFNVLKGVTQNAMFYIEDALTEQNLFTATRKKSVYNLAKLSGYVPYYGSAAAGTIICSTKINDGLNVSNINDTNVSTKIYITNGSQVRNTNTGLVYTLLLPTDEYVIDISKPLVKHEFKVVEGSWLIFQYTGIGVPFETFSVGVNGLYDANYIEITVNGVKFEQVSSVYDMGCNDYGYVVIPGYDSLFDVEFGNGTYGYNVCEGDTIVVKYISHSGTRGNIDDINTNLMFDKGLPNASGEAVNPSNYLDITQKSPITGGTNADTIQEVKNAVGGSTSSSVYTTPENFKLFLTRFSFVGWCNVFCNSNSLSVTGVCLSNIYNKINNKLDYYSISEDELLLSSNEKKLIITTLENSKKLYAGIQFSLQDPVIRKYAAICYVKLIDHSINRDNVIDKIKTQFADYFLNLQSSTLYIPKSDIITRMMNNLSDIIESFDFDFISETEESAYASGYYTQYKQQLINGQYKYIPYIITYEPDSRPGLDDFGNISLSSELEVPLFHGGFKYYPNKDVNNYNKTKSNNINNNNTSIMINETVQVYFI